MHTNHRLSEFGKMTPSFCKTCPEPVLMMNPLNGKKCWLLFGNFSAKYLKKEKAAYVKTSISEQFRFTIDDFGHVGRQLVYQPTSVMRVFIPLGDGQGFIC